MKLLKESDDRKKQNNEFGNEKEEVADEDDEEENKDEIELMKEENELEDDLQISISEVFGAIFQTHKPNIGPLLNIITTEYLPNCLKETNDTFNKFGLFVICDLIEHLGADSIGAIFNDIAGILLKYGESDNPVLR